MLQNLKKRNQGFTIVEVMIVLAIGGLIMLIVFLAVPALQRTSRNNARNNDAARVAAAVTECLANNNGIVANCPVASINVGTLSRLDTFAIGAAAYTQTEARITFNSQCNAAGSQAVAGGGTRAFSITYQLEPAVNRCIAS